MRVLLVNPPPFQVIEPFYDRPEYPRAAIATLAGYLRSKNVDIHVLDGKFDRLDFSGCLKRVKELKPDIVGFTAFTNEIKPAAHLARTIKSYNPAIKTVAGGVHVTALPEKTLREFPEFDFGVVGEGEETLHDLIVNSENRSDLSQIPGLCFLAESGKYVYGGERAKIADQDSIAFPAWDMFRPAKEYHIQSSRGCPYACDFCMNPNGRTVRPRSPKNVLDEIGWLIEAMNPESIFFGDEIFSVLRDRTLEICKGFVARGFHKKLTWWGQTHIRTIDLELAQSMKDAGCRLVGLGIESGDEETLKLMGKGLNLNRIFEAVKIMKQVGLPFQTFFILGQPNETRATVMNTIDLAVKINPTLPIFGIMVPYPGTEIAEMARKGEGGYVLLTDDWNEYNKQFGNALAFKNLSRKELERLQFWGYLKVFLWNLRLWDMVKFLWKYKTEGVAVIKKQLRLTFEEISIFTPFKPKAGRIAGK